MLYSILSQDFITNIFELPLLRGLNLERVKKFIQKDIEQGFIEDNMWHVSIQICYPTQEKVNALV